MSAGDIPSPKAPYNNFTHHLCTSNPITMQHEDDLRGLAKVMQFMRALSILILILHIYWYCYDWMLHLG